MTPRVKHQIHLSIHQLCVLTDHFHSFWPVQQNVTMSVKESETDEAKIFAGLNGQGPVRQTDPSTGLSNGHINWAFQDDKNPAADSDSDTCCHGDDSITQESQRSDEETGQTCKADTHSIILDLSAASFVDTVTVKTLKNVCVCRMCVCTVI